MHIGPIDRLSNLTLLVLRQNQLDGAPVLFHVLDLLRARDGNDILPLRQQPRQRQLPGRAPFRLRQRPDLVHELQVFGEILLREARKPQSGVTGLEIVAGLVLTGEESPAERAVGDDGNVELATGFEQSNLRIFNVGGKGAVFDLQRSDRVDFVRPAEGGRRNFTQSEVSDFTFSL